ncbi:hypothetical protein GQ457_14G023230 [Hibiscus cannabinus]
MEESDIKAADDPTATKEAKEKLLRELPEYSATLANLLSEFQKTQAANKKLNASLMEAHKELARLKALQALRSKSDSPLATYKWMAVELEKLRQTYG